MGGGGGAKKSLAELPPLKVYQFPLRPFMQYLHYQSLSDQNVSLLDATDVMVEIIKYK